MPETGYKYRDALRLLFVIVLGAEPLAEADPATGATTVFIGEKRLMAVDFWIRYHDHFAEKLLDAYEATGDVSLLAETENIFEREEPSLRLVKMLRWRRGAYDHIEDALSVLSSKNLIFPRESRQTNGSGRFDYVLARLRPEQVGKLVLVDCLVPGTENTDALHGGAWHYGFHMTKDIPELLTAGREREYIRAQIRAWSHRKDAIGEAAISEHARHYASPGGMTAGFNYYRALPDDARFLASLPRQRLSIPVMTLGGSHGVGTRLADTLRPEADDLTALVAPKAGHFVAEEAPGFFQETVGRFLSA